MEKLILIDYMVNLLNDNFNVGYEDNDPLI